MHTAIVAMLIVIALILLGLFTPMLYGIVVGLFAVAPKLMAVGVAFLITLAGLLVYHAVKSVS